MYIGSEGDVLQHGHHHPQHLAEQRVTGAADDDQELSLRNPDETQKDAAILLGPSRPVGKSSIKYHQSTIMYQLSQRQFSHGSACADLALLRTLKRLALINIHMKLN